MDLFKGVMDLFKGKQDQQQPPPPQQFSQQGCVQRYQVSTPTADPCADYVPPTSQSLLQSGQLGSQSSATSDLLNALAGGSGAGGTTQTQLLTDYEFDGGLAPSVGDQVLDQSALGGDTDTSAQAGAKEAEEKKTQPQTPPVTGTLAQQAVNLQSGTRGDIEVSGTGVTFIAQARDEEASTEVAGFVGADTFGAEPQGMVARLCKTRPWASSIITYVIPPSFFDSLCAWRGHEVGIPVPPPPPPRPTTVIQTTPASPTPSATAEVRPPSVTPEVDIWAVPERVPLGARTSIFWNTKGVESCTVSSPDGSFNENALSGGAATVPLSGPTTFTISCLSFEGAPVTDHVTVNLAI